MKKFIILFLTLLITTNAFAAGSDSSSSEAQNNQCTMRELSWSKEQVS